MDHAQLIKLARGLEPAEILIKNGRMVNVYTGEIKNVTTGEEIKAKPYPDFIMKIVEAGGIGSYIRSRKSEYKLLK